MAHKQPTNSTNFDGEDILSLIRESLADAYRDRKNHEKVNDETVFAPTQFF